MEKKQCFCNQKCLKPNLQFISSAACAIELEESVIVTGGIASLLHLKHVTEYDQVGNYKELPKLLTGRYGHGCGHYINNDNKMVG